MRSDPYACLFGPQGARTRHRLERVDLPNNLTKPLDPPVALCSSMKGGPDRSRHMDGWAKKGEELFANFWEITRSN